MNKITIMLLGACLILGGLALAQFQQNLRLDKKAADLSTALEISERQHSLAMQAAETAISEREKIHAQHMHQAELLEQALEAEKAFSAIDVPEHIRLRLSLSGNHAAGSANGAPE